MNSDFIGASFDTLYTQASDTASSYMHQAQEEIDKKFGNGYAAKHPELIVAFMQTAVSNFNTSSTLKVFSASMLRISENLSKIAEKP